MRRCSSQTTDTWRLIYVFSPFVCHQQTTWDVPSELSEVEEVKRLLEAAEPEEGEVSAVSQDLTRASKHNVKDRQVMDIVSSTNTGQ